MVRVFADIEQEIRALGRNDQVRLLRALLDELEALPDAMSPRVLRAAIEIDLAAANDYIARHGSFAELAREHYAGAAAASCYPIVRVPDHPLENVRQPDDRPRGTHTHRSAVPPGGVRIVSKVAKSDLRDRA